MDNTVDFLIRDTEERTKKIKKIILCHTSREINEYLVSLKKRHSGKYKKIPHYIITREGKILNTLSKDQVSIFFYQDSLNSESIIISLENLGWLEKKPLNDEYLNWIGNIYKGDVITKSWRDYFFWQPYTDNQMKSLAKLCGHLSQIEGINNECIGTNTKIKGVEKFEGIITRSNLYIQLTDVSPAFDFEKFEKYLRDEQQL